MPEMGNPVHAAGTVFARENATRIKQIGLWLVAYAVAPFASVELLILLQSVIDRAWFHLAEVRALVLGGILLVVAQVMEAGHAIGLTEANLSLLKSVSTVIRCWSAPGTPLPSMFPSLLSRPARSACVASCRRSA
jgi:hypothetical protein